jgi:FtsP/CotA-like multicopper oxidase with cupredoxin domain
MEAGGKAYLFRMVNAGQSLGLMVSVEGHKLQVVSTDGAPVMGVEADFVLLFPGERYDFLIISKEEPDRPYYYMIVETLDYMDWYWNRIQPWYGLARIQYSNDTSCKTKPDVAHSRCTEESPCVVVNCPLPSWPKGFNMTCANVETMEYLGQPETEALKPSYDNDDKYEEYFLNMHYDNVMNGWLFKYPKAPPYFYNQNENKVMYSCTKDHWNGVRNSWCTYTLNITLGNTVQLTLYNMGQGGDMASGFHHPVHLHGTHFHIVKVGYGTYNESTGYLEASNEDFPCADSTHQCDHLEWSNKTWLHGNVPGMNLQRPVFKDTVTLPAGGYVVLRFKADNPGWWVMHCHIMVHHMGGMAFAIKVGEHDQMPAPPAGFPQGCGVYDPADYHPDTTGTTIVGTSATTTTTAKPSSARKNSMIGSFVIVLMSMALTRLF